LSSMAAQWSAEGNTRLTEMLGRLDRDSRFTRDSALRLIPTPSYIVGDGGSSAQVVLSASTVPPEVIAHSVDVAAGANQGTVIGTATYRGTSVDITLTYSSRNDRNGSTPNPPRSIPQHIAGYALTQCMSSTVVVSPSCTLIQTQKATAVLDLPLPCEQTVFGSGTYVANLSLLTTMSVGIISVPFDVDLPSPIANDIEKRASSPTCSPPIAHFHMHGPTMYGSDGGSITEETTSGQIAVSLNQDAQ